MGLIEDVMKGISENPIGVKPSYENLGLVAKRYMYHRTIREQEDLLRRAEGDQIRNILVDLGVPNKIVEFEGKHYKCFAVVIEPSEKYDVPDEVLLKYIPKEILNLHKQYTRGYSYGYALDVTEDVKMLKAEMELKKDE